MPATDPELDRAALLGRAAGRAGRPVTECPYADEPAPEKLRRDLWLRWHSYEKLTAAGFPA